MKARKRTVFGIIGTTFALSFVLVETGCSLQTAVNYNDETGILSLTAKVSEDRNGIQRSTTNQFICFDLDTRAFETRSHNGREYSYFYDIDCLYDEDSQLLVLHDDPDWDEYFEEGFKQAELSNESEYLFLEIQDDVIKGTITPSLETAAGLQDGNVKATLNLAGGSPIPVWDEVRWSSLSRQLFLIKDGEEGSPDPIVMNLSGNASDVFGYMFEVGITNGSATVHNQEWTMHIDSSGEWADVYIDNSLVTSVLLH
ncbi:MAG: hypothetical protein H8E86_02080 [Planctomycetes bacterium]|nr:hypothetical protein [Planctomycetota bacterium]